MIAMIKHLCLAIVALAAINVAHAGALPSAAPEEVGLSAERLARIGAVMNAGVRAGEIPGAVVLVARRGKVAYFEAFGYRDRAAGAPMPRDAIFRIYSMTKPIVSVAAMTLHEEGRFYLGEPLSKYVPAFANMRVGVERFDEGTGKARLDTEPARRPITMHDLLRHSSGLTYALIRDSAVKRRYRAAGLSSFTQDMTLAEYTARLAKLPLAYQPGTVWDYGRSTDVLGRVVEVVSEQPLDRVLRERVFTPLGMADSGFSVPPDKHHRIAQPHRDPATGRTDNLIDVTRAPKMFAGGHGMVSTAEDYARFCLMMLGGGALDGVRVLGRNTVAYMTADHLGDEISKTGTLYLPGPGHGFGLGFAVRTHAGRSPWPGSVGEYFWGGYAGTYFWIDPAEELVVVYMMQSVGMRNRYRKLLRTLVGQAIID